MFTSKTIVDGRRWWRFDDPTAIANEYAEEGKHRKSAQWMSVCFAYYSFDMQREFAQNDCFNPWLLFIICEKLGWFSF